MTVIPATRLARPRRWPAVVAWITWAVTMVACLVIHGWTSSCAGLAGPT